MIATILCAQKYRLLSGSKTGKETQAKAAVAVVFVLQALTRASSEFRGYTLSDSLDVRFGQCNIDYFLDLQIN